MNNDNTILLGNVDGMFVFTTTEDIEVLFGDIVAGEEYVSRDQFLQLKQRCEEKGWKTWLEFWRTKVLS